MRKKFKELPVIIDVLVIVQVSVALWFMYKEDMLGYTELLKFFSFHLHGSWKCISPLLEVILLLRFYLFAFFHLILAIGLYSLARWAFWLTLFFNVVIIFSAPLWIWKIFAVITIGYLIFEREFFGIGRFQRPELKKIVHIEYDHGRKIERIISGEKKDPRLEEMIASRNLLEAREYIHNMTEVARHVGDMSRVIYYAKCLEKINRLQRRTIR